ncbi:MAG: hypothetical protein ACT4PV_08580 [Planctomycetaceae bacterium]
MSPHEDPVDRTRIERATGARDACDRVADVRRRIAEGELDTPLAYLETAAGLIDAGPHLRGDEAADPV